MRKKVHYVWISVALGLLVCLAQIRGNSLLIYACMAALVALITIASIDDYTLPVLLFFLPWMPILRANPDSFSFFTLSTVLVCAVRAYKTKFCFERYQIIALILLLILTLTVRLTAGDFPNFSYIFFMMYLALFPECKEEVQKRKYDLYHVVVMFAAGCATAALCAQAFAGYANIAKYVNVHNYLTITRMCGFYGDPNYYCAQITAALSGCLVLLVREKKRSHLIVLGILTFGLLYCGFLSGSKSFLLVTVTMVLLWFIKLMRAKGKLGRKIVLIIISALTITYVLTSQLFAGLLEVVLTRLSWSTNASEFTTGRTDLWLSYLQEMGSDMQLLLFGRGCSDIKVDGRAAHNTLIQIVYQFGVVGTPVLVYWLIGYFRGLGKVLRKETLCAVILLIGTVIPWIALDILFFDDFFLLLMYVYVAFSQLQRENR